MDVEPFVRVLLAAALVTPVGLDPELRGKAAGLRTHVLVGTAAAALGYVSVLVVPRERLSAGRSTTPIRSAHAADADRGAASR